MSKLTFYTPTTLDEAFIFTMGASVKKSTNPIGFFGTGLKYAIAVTLRLGGSVKITTNEHTYRFITEVQNIRGEDMTMIYCLKDTDKMNAERIRCPMTTSYGKTWEPWMVMRELWSNTKDEGGKVISDDDDFILPYEEEYTIITVEESSIYDAWLTRDKYIINPLRQPLYSTSTVDIYQGRNDTVFYRGIAVSRGGSKTGFTYNIKSMPWNLTEDRTIEEYYLRSVINAAITHCKDKPLLSSIFDHACKSETVESRLPYSAYSLGRDTSTEYAEEMVACVRRESMNAPSSMMAAANEYIVNLDPEEFYKPYKINDEQATRFTECINLLTKKGFDFSPYKIYFTQVMPGEQYGAANQKHNIIVLSVASTVGHENWLKQTCMTLIEEYVHLRYKVSDHTREMQEAYNECMFYLITQNTIDKSL